jgi:hypothetical protein
MDTLTKAQARGLVAALSEAAEAGPATTAEHAALLDAVLNDADEGIVEVGIERFAELLGIELLSSTEVERLAEVIAALDAVRPALCRELGASMGEPDRAEVVRLARFIAHERSSFEVRRRIARHRGRTREHRPRRRRSRRSAGCGGGGGSGGDDPDLDEPPGGRSLESAILDPVEAELIRAAVDGTWLDPGEEEAR